MYTYQPLVKKFLDLNDKTFDMDLLNLIPSKEAKFVYFRHI